MSCQILIWEHLFYCRMVWKQMSFRLFLLWENLTMLWIYDNQIEWYHCRLFMEDNSWMILMVYCREEHTVINTTTCMTHTYTWEQWTRCSEKGSKRMIRCMNQWMNECQDKKADAGAGAQTEPDLPMINSLYLNGAYFHGYKNVERQYTVDTIVSWPNPKQWVINSSYVRFDDDNETKYICSLNITREMGKLKTHSPTYCIMDNWENMLNLTHTLDKIYLTSIL